MCQCARGFLAPPRASSAERIFRVLASTPLIFVRCCSRVPLLLPPRPLAARMLFPFVGLQLDVVWCLIQGYLFRGGAEGATDALRQLRTDLTKALMAAENR